MVVILLLLTSNLKFNPVAVVTEGNLIFSISHQDIVDKTFDSCIKESSNEECIILEKLVLTLGHFFIDIGP